MFLMVFAPFCGLFTMQNAPYNPAASVTHQDVPCSSDVCAAHHCDAQLRCSYSREFAENSSASGILAVDVLGFTPAEQNTSQARESEDSASRASITGNTVGATGSGAGGARGVARVVFGCTERETGQLCHQRADGVLGLGRGIRSLVQQLATTHGFRHQFSLCYAGLEQGKERGGGLLVLGESPQPTPPMAFTPLNPKAS